MTRRGVALGLVAAAAAALSGCGTYGERDAARGTVDSFLAACAEDHATDAYEMLVPAGQRAFAAAGSATAGCGRILRASPGAATASDLRAASVGAVDVASDHGTARVVLAGHPKTVTLDLTSDGWRLEAPS